MTSQQNIIETIQHNTRRLIAESSWRMPEDWRELGVLVRLAFGAIMTSEIGNFDAIPPDELQSVIDTMASTARSFAVMANICEAASAFFLAQAA
jgi:hypothetical protein